MNGRTWPSPREASPARNRRWRALFVTHDCGLYGASNSLQLLLRNLPDVDYDLVIPRRLLGRQDLRAIHSRFGGRAGNLWEIHLPFDFCFRYRPERSLRHLLEGELLRKAMWRMDRGKLRAILRRGRYDFVHLNSLVLHGAIDRENRYILHVRDIYDGSNRKVFDSVRSAAGVIFIDGATREPFSGAALPRNVVLNNPFDMTGSDASPLPGADPLLAGLDRCTVFSLIGRVTEKKGAEFVIRCFRDVPAPDSRLLLVGGGDPEELRRCRRLAEGDPRILFRGEEKDIRRIYGVTDYVLRGEAFQCIGRTIYEGLYAGCSVILPAVQEGEAFLFEYDRYRDSVHLYPPRDASALKGLFRGLSGRKAGKRTFRSNVPEYVASFRGFVREILESPAGGGSAG